MQLGSIKKSAQGFAMMPQALRLLWKASPKYFFLTAIAMIVQGLIPAAIALVAKLIIDALVAANGINNELILLIGLEGFLALSLGVLKNVSALSASALREEVQKYLSLEVQAHAAHLDLEFFEMPGNYDEFAKAKREIAFRPFVMAIALFGVVTNLATVAGFFIVVLAFQPVLAIALVVAAIPAFIAGRDAGFVSFNTYDLMTPEGRRAAYIEKLMTESTYAKEIRLFGLALPFLAQARIYATNILQARLAVERKRALNFSLSAFFSIAVQYAALGFVVVRAATGQISIGDFVLLATALATVRTQLSEAFASSGELFENCLFFEDLTKFLAQKPQISDPGEAALIPTLQVDCLQFEGVGFAYPGAETPVFEHLDLRLHANEVTAIVGVNGAGKTTLVKLLTRLYDPDEGRILYDGVDIRQFAPDVYRSRFGVIMQDFVKYQFSLQENIAVGLSAEQILKSRLESTLRDANLADLARDLPEGVDTLLGRQFHVRGQDLSGGQWQRVALARALYRNAPIIVLDEPTAALDAEAEARIFEQYRELTKDKLSVLISHRFNTVRLADRIIVFEAGRVVEDGSHQGLMRLGGRYATMFNRQAEGYMEHVEQKEAVKYA